MIEGFNGSYRRRKVLLTGHSGFKGSWMALWLDELGADLVGYSLPAPSSPNHAELLEVGLVTVPGDVRDAEHIRAVCAEQQPEIVFHFAAQSLVRHSYTHPRETFETNVLGTVNVLEAARLTPSVKALVVVTSDKCYDNKEWVWGYRENDPMGGFDPYSASKGCAELVTQAYQRSYFAAVAGGESRGLLCASVRAGNVIGGGDWAADRLIPDVVRAVVEDREVVLRNPQATRPWQHVLDPLSGYLLIGQRLLEGRSDCAEAWNFGPSDEGALTVGQVVEQASGCWDQIRYRLGADGPQPHEAHFLKLDCSKAHLRLGWSGLWDSRTAIARTIEWYRRYYRQNQVASREDLGLYLQDAKQKQAVWAR